MTSKTLRIALGSVLALVLLLAVADILGAIWVGRTVNAELFEREVRARLPLGSSRSKVEEFLRQRKVPFTYDGPSGTLTALLRKVGGGTFVVTKSLQFRFRFDEDFKLNSVDSKALYTGP